VPGQGGNLGNLASWQRADGGQQSGVPGSLCLATPPRRLASRLASGKPEHGEVARGPKRGTRLITSGC